MYFSPDFLGRQSGFRLGTWLGRSNVAPATGLTRFAVNLNARPIFSVPIVGVSELHGLTSGSLRPLATSKRKGFPSFDTISPDKLLHVLNLLHFLYFRIF